MDSFDKLNNIKYINKVYLSKNDWEELILPKLSKEEKFKQEYLELKKIYNTIKLLCQVMP